MNDLSFPIGPFVPHPPYTDDEVEHLIDVIEDTPRMLREAVEGLTDDQLDTPYRPDGWTVRQVVHHVPDSHMNAYVRTRLAATVDRPSILAYDQDAWARLADASLPIGVSLDLLDAVHERWVVFLRGIGPEGWRRRYHHPEVGELDIATTIDLYAWHGPHHVAHVVGLRERHGW